MPIEPGIVDANVLVYALGADAPQHAASRALIEAARDGDARLYVTSQIICEFYSIVTNGRRVSKPRSSADALNAVTSLLAFLDVLPVPAGAVDGWLGLLHRHPVVGAELSVLTP
jgi:predicted nucleic acid-binding protein